MRPTVVLVHGAFAESSSWDQVVEPLMAQGHRVIAAANPLRSLAGDAAAISDLVRTIEGPVVLAAGHGVTGVTRSARVSSRRLREAAGRRRDAPLAAGSTSRMESVPTAPAWHRVGA